MATPARQRGDVADRVASVGVRSQEAPADLPQPDRPKIDPPLVSFVLVNWNYARHVGAAIDSIRAQTYRRFHCMIIDNASTDDSRDVIRERIAGDARFEVVHLDTNLGQLGALLHIRHREFGEFVCIVDADDILLPDFALLHIQAHFALPAPVAVTSSNVFEISGDGTVIAGGRSGFHAQVSRALQGIAGKGPRLDGVSEADLERLCRRITPCPLRCRGWWWSPGTANVFRREPFREALLILSAPVPPTYPSDGYLLEIAQLVGGTALIDIPLSFYRIHASNVSGGTVSMVNSRSQSLVARAISLELRRVLCASLIRRREQITRWLPESRFWDALNQVFRPPIEASREYCDPRVLAAFGAELPALARDFGWRKTIEELSSRVAFGPLWRMLTTAPRVPFLARLVLLWHQIATMSGMKRGSRLPRPV